MLNKGHGRKVSQKLTNNALPVSGKAMTDELNGTVLYSNTSGTNANVALSDSVFNYRKIDIICKNEGGDGFTASFYPNENTSLQITSSYVQDVLLYNEYSTYSYSSGTSLTYVKGGGVTVRETDNTIYGTSLSNKMKIFKVIGYK